MIAVSRAELSDVETVLRILNEAAAWLCARGVDQWEVGQWRRAKLAAAIERGETYLASDGMQVVATLTLQWIDECSGPVVRPTQALCIGLRSPMPHMDGVWDGNCSSGLRWHRATRASATCGSIARATTRGSATTTCYSASSIVWIG